MKNKNRTYSFTFYHDPGHAWMSVKRALLLEHPLAALAVSHYSYQRGATVYLEEDCDAGLILEALRSANKPFVVVSQYCDRHSPIRSYDRFSLTESEKAALEQEVCYG